MERSGELCGKFAIWKNSPEQQRNEKHRNEKEGKIRMNKIDKVKKATEKGKVDKLITFAGDADKGVRLAAITGLGEQTESETSLNALVKMMNDNDPDVRREVAASLGSFSGSYVETQLQYCLFHEKDETVLEIIRDSLDRVRKKK